VYTPGSIIEFLKLNCFQCEAGRSHILYYMCQTDFSFPLRKEMFYKIRDLCMRVFASECFFMSQEEFIFPELKADDNLLSVVRICVLILNESFACVRCSEMIYKIAPLFAANTQKYKYTHLQFDTRHSVLLVTRQTRTFYFHFIFVPRHQSTIYII